MGIGRDALYIVVEGNSVRVGVARNAHNARAFNAARRHSMRVRGIRVTLVVGVIAVMATVSARTLIGAFGALAPGLALGELSINGAKIIMNAPTLSGSRRNGEGYVVTAAKAEQDALHPAGVDLTIVQGNITTADHDTIHMTAANGHYETDRETLELGGGVSLSNARYRIDLRTSRIDFKAGTYISEQPVTVQAIPDTFISADSLSIRDNGGVAQFAGHVRTLIHKQGHVPAADPHEGGKP